MSLHMDAKLAAEKSLALIERAMEAGLEPTPEILAKADGLEPVVFGLLVIKDPAERKLVEDRAVLLLREMAELIEEALAEHERKEQE